MKSQSAESACTPAERTIAVRVMSTPRTVEIAITGRCNLRCSYCSHFNSDLDCGTDLPAAEWLDLFQELNALTVMRIVLEGGEPLCREDLPELIEGIIRNRMRFSILSNGALFTEEIASMAASSNRCESIQISIDGSEAAFHDVFRGRGSLEKAAAGIALLKQYSIPLTARVTIHNRNYDDLEKIAVMLLNKLSLPEISFNEVSFFGSCRDNSDQVQLSTNERSAAMRSLLQLEQTYGNRIKALAGPLIDAKIWYSMVKAYRENRKPQPYEGRLAACRKITNSIAIRSDGIIIPCIHLSHIELGRINTDDLAGIWRSHSELIRLRERNAPLRSFSFCSDCMYADYCPGGCPALAYSILGDDNHPNPRSCLRRFLEDGGKLPEEALFAHVPWDDVSGTCTPAA